MSFLPTRTSPSVLYYNLKILKFSDVVSLQNISLLHNLYNNTIPICIGNTFAINFSHKYRTRAEKQGLINLPMIRTTHYGTHSIRFHSIKMWNYLQKTLPYNLMDINSIKLKLKLKEYYFNS